MKRVEGHTPAKWAAALRRIENQMHRGHDGQEITRWITEPFFGADDETFERLHGIVGAPEVPLERRLAEIEARRRELEALPEIDARYGLRVVLVAYALALIWYLFAANRDDTERQWQFVRAILKAAGEESEGVRKNPKRLERLRLDVERLMLVTARRPAGNG